MIKIEFKVLKIRNLSLSGKEGNQKVRDAEIIAIANILGVEPRNSVPRVNVSDNYNHAVPKEGRELRVYYAGDWDREFGTFILTRIVDGEEIFMDKGTFNSKNGCSLYVNGENFGNMSLHCEELR